MSATLLADEDDLHDVISTVADLAGSWRALGIALKLRQGDLDSIVLASAHSPGDCLGKMLTLWLKQNYNVCITLMSLVLKFCSAQAIIFLDKN